MLKTKTYPSFDEEKYFWKNKTLVIGVDEVGRGAFAGPIVASAVVYPLNFKYGKDSLISSVNDSKQVKPNLRVKLSKEILNECIYHSTAQVEVKTINRIGIGEANKIVFRKVIADVIAQAKKDGFSSFHLLVDGFHVKFIREIGLKHQKAIVKGDQKSFTIASASILAKVHRDRLMKKQSKDFPMYAFAKNKGYGTSEHQKALKEFGVCKLHRTAFVDSILSKPL